MFDRNTAVTCKTTRRASQTTSPQPTVRCLLRQCLRSERRLCAAIGHNICLVSGRIGFVCRSRVQLLSAPHALASARNTLKHRPCLSVCHVSQQQCIRSLLLLLWF